MRSTELVCVVSFGVYLLAFIMLVAGFASPYWYKDESDTSSDVRSGLFRACVGDDCDNVDIKEAEDWFKATVALMACAFIFALVAGFASIFLPVTSGLQIIAGLFALVGIAIYASEFNEAFEDNDDVSLQWAFGLAAGGGALLLINGILLGAYAGFLGCYMDRVLPCLDSKRDYGYDDPYARRPQAPVYPQQSIAPTSAYGARGAYMGGAYPQTYATTAAPSTYPGTSVYPGANSPYGNFGGRTPRQGYARGSMYQY